MLTSALILQTVMSEHTETYFHRLFSPENLPNIGLFFAGIVGIIVAICTLKAILKQTTASQNSERAWILVNTVGNPIPLSGPITPGYSPGIVYNFKVSGHTPATIVGVRMRCHLVEHDEQSIPNKPKLPPTPNYVSNRMPPEIPEGGRTLAPDTVFSLEVNLESTILTSEELSDLRDGKKFFCAYGFIEYRDAFGEGRKTQFCYVYYWPAGGVIRSASGYVLNAEGFRLGGPPAYNSET